MASGSRRSEQPGSERPDLSSQKPRTPMNSTRLVVLGGFAAAGFALLASPIAWSAKAMLGCFLATALGAVWLTAWLRAWARALRADDDRGWLYEHGRPAVGTLIQLYSLNESMNNDPVARVQLRISPTDGSRPVEGVRDAAHHDAQGHSGPTPLADQQPVGIGQEERVAPARDE